MIQDNMLNDHQESITHYTYLGLLPFFICAFGPWVFADYERVLSQFFFFYATMILTFLAGSLWAVALFSTLEHRQRHIHMAIVFSLWPIPSYFLPSAYPIGFMLSGFLLLLFWEKCFINQIYPNWYQHLRHKVTFIVVACHMLVIWNLIRSQ